VSIDDSNAPDLLYCELDRIAGLVDAALQTPTPTHECLRCGNRWTGRTVHPKTCPLCHSAYWDTSATTAHGRTPSEAERRRLRKAAVKRRRADRLRAKARKHGITLEPLPQPTLVQELASDLNKELAKQGIEILPAVIRQRYDELAKKLDDNSRLSDMEKLSEARRPRTVPPPPGLEDMG
jgi:hypothetical protein